MITLLFTLLACTDTQRTKVFGGEMTVQVPCDQVVFDVTWKGENLWYATQPAGAALHGYANWPGGAGSAGY